MFKRKRKTHLQQFEDLLADANLNAIARVDMGLKDTTITLKNTGTYGYKDFISMWEFDGDGKLKSISHWE